ncbi:hypothetical protein EJB05_53343 [Eragrostis curvula]|uniref:Membrane protein of ER body-like protein n=1 Tax=Eragrostis curvula TaxID=38414 RepID=A0A5J9SQF3_9POAL|nr:hypothetical protein EJB05_53343 [Eragrostis curvula]
MSSSSSSSDQGSSSSSSSRSNSLVGDTMMEVEKPWEFKEEVDIMEEEEEDAGALHTRERKNKAADHHGNGQPPQEEGRDDEEQKQNVFFDSTNGLWKCRHCDWTYRFSSRSTDDILNHQGYCQIARNLELLVRNEQFYYSSGKDNVTESSTEQEVTEAVEPADEKENSNDSAKVKDLEKQENLDDKKDNQNPSNGELKNGSHSNGVHEASSSNETVTIADGEAGLKLIATIGESATSLMNLSGALDISNSITNRTQVHEIEVEKDENVIKGKVKIEEYDLEKILDEQETHDLFCPNCKSCITRRVILRKRKRTVKQASGDEPSKKPQIAEPSADASNQTAAERRDRDAPEVFRCLSCFTFFTPTGYGFNIFRIFGRRDVDQQQVHDPSTSHQTENCGSWLLSCFPTLDSPKTSDAGPTKEPASGSQSTDHKISSVEDTTASAHGHTTYEETEQPKKPLPAGSSSVVQTAVTVNPSSTTTSTTLSWQSITGFMPAKIGQMVTGQPDIGPQEQIPLSKPASTAVTDVIHPYHKEDIRQNTTVVSSDKNSFFNPEFFGSEVKFPVSGGSEAGGFEVKFPATSPTKVVPDDFVYTVNDDDMAPAGDKNLKSREPTPVITPPNQSDHLTLPILHDEVLPTPVPAPAQRDEWDILKAIVYGGLVESITSLSVVSAAAASGAKTLDIFVLGIANLIGGLPIIFHSIVDLRTIGGANENDERVGHYWQQLGRRTKYRLHMVIAILSYILFGLLPPVIYGLSFRESDNRENKMMAVAAASLACIALLAIGKAHVKTTRTYFTTLLYYLSVGFSGSGLSYVVGVLITRLLAHFGLIDQGGSAPTAAPSPPGLLLPDAMGAGATAWASY